MKYWRLIVLGIASLVPYLFAYRLQDLRKNTVAFEYVFFAAFVLYAVAAWLVLRANGPTTRREIAVIFAFAIVFNAVLVMAPPTLSDDMYRYVWDGRVQAHQISPYAYPPSEPQLANLRDTQIWPLINRKDDVTVYPAAAELAFAAIWRIVPDSVRWFQIVIAACSLLGDALLALLLRAFGKPARWVLVYLWHPLVIFETAHAAHVDGLILPLLVAAWLATAKGRDGWAGAALGAATAIKLYPALLLPALWRLRDDKKSLRPAWQMPLAFAATIGACYLPYLAQGAGVVGFLPQYFGERYNMGLASFLTAALEKPPLPIVADILKAAGGSPQHVIDLLLFAALALTGLALMLRPAATAEHAVARCIWPIAAFTLLTQNLFPWYMLWLVPLLVPFVRPGEIRISVRRLDRLVSVQRTGRAGVHLFRRLEAGRVGALAGVYAAVSMADRPLGVERVPTAANARVRGSTFQRIQV
ncbi:MAG: glycosyltransferase 87 family protein [Chloroflexi bacterium]|nr:glycosyltransferase 87 family protein [Chloroflexota bacterium]